MFEVLKEKINLKVSSKDFTIEFGDRGWMRHPINGEFHHIIVTNIGVFFDGKIIAKGNLECLKSL